MTALRNQTVLITGASTGFGKGIALACAKAGANVALVARRESLLNEVAAEVAQLGCKTVVCPADVAEEVQILAAVRRAEAELGPIHVLVNNAGTNVTERSIQDTSSDQWRMLLEVNLTSAFLFSKAILPDMIRREQGTIINVASKAARYPSLLAGVAYSSSKLGMNALTEVTNEEGNPHNVRATVINPGEGNTPILDRRPSPPPQDVRERMLQIEDLGEIVVMVASLPPRVNIKEIYVAPTRM